jgi:cytochrome c biogenesis protein ResB
VSKYLSKNPAATARMDLFGKLGLTHVFYSWWFIGLLMVLAATVATCSTRRFATVRRATGATRRHALGSMLTHVSILLILTGGVIRGVWGEKGYLEFREGETASQFVAENGPQTLPFGIHLAKFAIETYGQPAKTEHGMDASSDCCNSLLVAWPEKNLQATLPVKVGVEQTFGDFKITVLKYIPDFSIDMATKEATSRSAEPLNPAILVAVNGPTYHNHRWVFAKFPDFGHEKSASPLEMRYQNHGAIQPKQMPNGPIKSFKSTVVLVDGDKAMAERDVEVNRPLTYKGYTFYQAGYNPRDLSYSSFQVVKDPGVPVVYAGFGLMIIGLFIVFYLNPWLSHREAAK